VVVGCFFPPVLIGILPLASMLLISMPLMSRFCAGHISEKIISQIPEGRARRMML